MLHLTMGPAAASAFIKAACDHARTPISISFQGRQLHINSMTAAAAASVLAEAAFPAREKKLLSRYCPILLPKADIKQRRLLITLAQILAEEDIPLQPLYQGAKRGSLLTKEFCRILDSGSLDLNGFCRFRLPGYEQYLKELLLIAEEKIQAKEEDAACCKLLASCLSQGKSRITLFFYQGDICQIWQQDQNGMRQLEGGCIRGAEWLLLANLIRLDPGLITVKNPIYAAPLLINMLEKIFGDRLTDQA